MPQKIDLALQGGGSHGAFTWGALDRLLEDDSPSFAGISGTSAGALNAAVMASGFAHGGRAGARAALTAFWLSVSRSASPFSPADAAAAAHSFGFDRLPGFQWLRSYFRSFSGYTGNPALFPLIYDTEALDLLLIKINPLVRLGTPKRNDDIVDRLSEITFNASLIGEMRAIAFVGRLVREGRLDAGRYKALRLHMVADEVGLSPFGAASKLDTDRAFLERLFRLGREAAARWLVAHRADVVVRGLLDIEAEFLAQVRRGMRS